MYLRGDSIGTDDDDDNEDNDNDDDRRQTTHFKSFLLYDVDDKPIGASPGRDYVVIQLVYSSTLQHCTVCYIKKGGERSAGATN
jgi:hypothetical protein